MLAFSAISSGQLRVARMNATPLPISASWTKNAPMKATNTCGRAKITTIRECNACLVGMNSCSHKWSFGYTLTNLTSSPAAKGKHKKRYKHTCTVDIAQCSASCSSSTLKSSPHVSRTHVCFSARLKTVADAKAPASPDRSHNTQTTRGLHSRSRHFPRVPWELNSSHGYACRGTCFIHGSLRKKCLGEQCPD